MKRIFKKLLPIGALALMLLWGAISPIKATITSETDRVSYTCNGTTTAYNYTFKIFEDDDILVVRKLTSTGAETTLTLTTDYTVSGAGTASGTVILTTGSNCPSGYTLHLIRNVELTQETDYVEGDTFPADAHEDALDKLAMEAQQLKSRTNRAIKFPVTENTDQVLGTPSDRSNKALGFDGSGNLSLLGTNGTGSYSTFLTQENTFSEKQTFNKGIVSTYYNSNYTAAGTDTYAVTITGYSAYTIGDTYIIKFTNANTITTPTLNITSLGAKTIKRDNGTALAVGDIAAGYEAILKYDGTNMILLNIAYEKNFTVEHNSNGTHKKAYGQAYRTATYNFAATNTWYDIPLNAGNNNLKNVSHSITVNPERVTVSVAGAYRITYSVVTHVATTQYHVKARLVLNAGNTEIVGSASSVSAGGGASSSFDDIASGSVIVSLVANDYIKIQAGSGSTTMELNVYDDAALPNFASPTTAIMTIEKIDE